MAAAWIYLYESRDKNTTSSSQTIILYVDKEFKD